MDEPDTDGPKDGAGKLIPCAGEDVTGAGDLFVVPNIGGGKDTVEEEGVDAADDA